MVMSIAPEQDPAPVTTTLEGSETVELVLERVVNSTMEQIVQLACEAIDGCSMAGLTLLDAGGPHTLAATGEGAQRVDAHQYEIGSGPRLDAYRNRAVLRVDSTASDARWPEFLRQARAEDVGSILSLPLVVREDGLGALNLYGEAEHAFRPRRGADRVGLRHARVIDPQPRTGVLAAGAGTPEPRDCADNPGSHRSGQGRAHGTDGSECGRGLRVLAPRLAAHESQGVRPCSGDRRIRSVRFAPGDRVSGGSSPALTSLPDDPDGARPIRLRRAGSAGHPSAP